MCGTGKRAPCQVPKPPSRIRPNRGLAEYLLGVTALADIMLGIKRIFEKQKDSGLRKELIFWSVLFVTWLVLVFLDSDRSWINWVLRVFPFAFFIYTFYACLSEMKRRKRKS